MGKRKIRINLMDLVILGVIIAAVVLVLYIFVWSEDVSETVQAEKTTLTYVVEVTSLDERYEGLIKDGQRVEDAVERGYLGTVTGTPEIRRNKTRLFDNTTQKEVYPEVEGKINMYITIEVEANVMERGYMVNGEYIYVGRLMSLMLQDMQCFGYCIQIDAEE